MTQNAILAPVTQVVVVAATPLAAAAEAVLLEGGTLPTRLVPAPAPAPPDANTLLLEGAVVEAAAVVAVVEAAETTTPRMRIDPGCLREGLGVTAELRPTPKTTTLVATRTLGLEI